MFRFTIRDVLWLTVVAGVVACWYRDRLSMATTMAKASAELASERDHLVTEWKTKQKEADERFQAATESARKWTALATQAKKIEEGLLAPIPTDAEIERMKTRLSPQPNPLSSATCHGAEDNGGMGKSNRVLPAVLIAVFVAVFLTAYCGAYVVMQSRAAQTGTNGRDAFTVRYYSADWHVVLFGPLAASESALRNHEIQLQYTP